VISLSFTPSLNSNITICTIPSFGLVTEGKFVGFEALNGDGKVKKLKSARRLRTPMMMRVGCDIT
jgi:hypothetical protein